MSSQPMTSAVNYPCPFEVNVANYVPLMLDETNYSVWKQLMLNLIESHELEGFVEGIIQRPPFPLEEHKQEEYRSWKRSDGLVKGWIFATVTEEILLKKVRLNTAGELEEVHSSSDESAGELEEVLSSSDKSGNALSLAGPGGDTAGTCELENCSRGLDCAREYICPSKSESSVDKAGNAVENILAPSESEPSDKAESEDNHPSRYLPLYKAIRNGDWDSATNFFEQEPDGVRDGITLPSETALMLAVRSSKRNDFVKKLLERIKPEDVARQDKFGQTALHEAVISGNNVVAKLLVEKNSDLPNIENEDGELPMHCAAERGNREMVDYLLEVTKMDGDPNPFEGELGVKLLNDLVYGKLYDIASTFLRRYPKLASMKSSPLMEICYHLTSFYSGTRLNFFQRLIYSGISSKLEGNANKLVRRDVENSAEGVVSPSVSHKLHAMFWDIAEKLVPMIKSVRETKLKHQRALKFVIDFCEEVVKSGSKKAEDIFFSTLGDAAILGACEVVEEIVEVCPDGITYKRNSDQKSLFQLAIENRQENVFNIIYQLDENQDTFLLKLDNLQNNALHTTGNFGDRQQLSLQANVAGAALQLQRELQWFKAVEKLLLPQRIYQRNSEDKTPQDVFTETHKNLVKDGEKWMKETASSCTIVAALIVTVVFAAAITVPGGLNNVDGLPIFLEDRVFFLFGMFDALALFSSTTSLLMFLSIFTSRYGEQDFLYSLPRKLIIGLVTLFLSVISMMIAFGATLKIVFGHKRAWFVFPVVVLSSLPITLFALLQFPLLLDIIRSTYYPGIFRKRSNRILY